MVHGSKLVDYCKLWLDICGISLKNVKLTFIEKVVRPVDIVCIAI